MSPLDVDEPDFLATIPQPDKKPFSNPEGWAAPSLRID
jgi:hypothetical protein